MTGVVVVTGALHRLAARRRASGRRAQGNLKDEAVDFLREAIVAVVLAPGTRIDQDEVAEVLGISRAPVREALIELAQKGFVDAVPRRGAFVAEVTADDIRDHYEVVAAVFGMTTRRAIGRLTPADLRELRRLHEEIGSTADEAARPGLDRRFFALIAGAGRSPRLDSVLLFLGGAPAGAFSYESPRWAAAAGHDRLRLLDALEAGDERAALAVAAEHLHTCAGLAIEHLRDSGYWAR